MSEQSTQIKCPNCGTSIDVQDIIAHQLEDELKKKYEAEWNDRRKQHESELEALSLAKEEFSRQKKRENELFQDRLDKRLAEEKKRMEESLVAKAKEEQKDQVEALQKELNTKSEQVKELHKTRAVVEQLKREKEELKEEAEAAAQKRLNDILAQEKEKIKKSEEEKNELQIRELNKKLEDQKRLTEEMKRKQEQGSMQMQGEVQELAIEDWLASQFPLDTIEEIKKGARGGDCIQTVHTRIRQNCGTIYYESKRTKEFQPGWIEKFKNDIREKGADIGVLVTEAMPAGMERLDMKDGVWVCSFEEFKGLSTVLRESVVQLSAAVATQENKGDKMGMLYEFLTGNEFRLQVEAIVEGFTQMQTDLESEKRAITGHWKRREKQILKVLQNTNFMYNSIKGIAGDAIQPVRALELPEVEDDEMKEDV